MRRSARQRSLGQAMIEYLVVLSFGVVVIMQGGTATEDPPIKKLATAIRDYHKHYSYAMSIASIPDCDYQLAYDKSLDIAGVNVLTGQIAVGFDRCIDWTNPQIPAIDTSSIVTALGIPTTLSDVGNLISTVTDQIISGFISDFSNPVGLLDDMFGFSPSDFF
jgi:hypothetical protein